ncbi:hypothetical protein [Microbacterium sp. zg-YB36]|uniref:hypothetical protein n=1 Tax=Microbacterium sp. zg-YB36 TaxID=2969407 RepID=UPI00214B31B9|nr:hypothetical protein [Microbacterium sp. zg-YB36]MDL5351117.1 hypothetical protein [Microbacterium sp. zg-YB36]
MSEDWAEYFKRVRAEAAQEVVIPPVTTTILEQEDVDPATLPAGAIKRLVGRLTAAQWPTVRLATSLVHVSDAFRVADSKLKPGEETPANRKGDLKKAAHDVRRWWVVAIHPTYRLGMRVEYLEGVTAKGGRSFTFQSAECRDPLGMPVELFVNYEPSSDDLKQVKDEPGWAHAERVARVKADAERRDYAYNTGHSWLNTRPLFKAAGEFTAWLDEAIDMTTKKEAA